MVFCAPASAGTAVVCLELPDVQADPGLVEAELYVGTADGDSEPLLQPLDHVIVGSNETFKGVVQLSGVAKTFDERERAERLARSTSGVIGVRNDIRVSG